MGLKHRSSIAQTTGDPRPPRQSHQHLSLLLEREGKASAVSTEGLTRFLLQHYEQGQVSALAEQYEAQEHPSFPSPYPCTPA